jgi:3-isopropylmalate/(R)-2-methylmalate dehydratase small subunit
MKLKGKVWKFKDNINTDEIIPARYLNTFDEQELAKHCMEDADKDFPKKVKPGDIIVAGKNFGCGSSREHAPICLKGAGVSCVIAETFARIFYRNAINIGLPILESVEASKGIEEGDTIEVDLEKGKIKNITTNKIYNATAFPPFMQELINAGGLMEYVKKQI